LFERSKTGQGTFIDVSMLETGLSLMSSTTTDYLKTGNAPQRRGNLANSRSPGAGSFPCKEGVMSLGVNEDGHFESLARALGCADWLENPSFATRGARKENAAALAEMIEAVLQTKTAEEWEPILQSAGVPSARLRSLPEALASDQVQARGFVYEYDDGLQVPTLPFRLGGVAAYAPSAPPPTHGEHTREIETELDQPEA
jgi:crotonobetainyl-CoA:carnitine CoA-transferase CaiB-like acyl-CoA transferase